MYEQLLDQQKQQGSVKHFVCAIPDGNTELKLIEVQFYEMGRGKSTGPVKQLSSTGMKVNFNGGKMTTIKNFTEIWFHPPGDDGLERVPSRSNHVSHESHSESSDESHSESTNRPSPKMIEIVHGVTRLEFDAGTGGNRIVSKSFTVTPGGERYAELMKPLTDMWFVNARIYGEGYKHTRPYIVGEPEKGKPVQTYHTSHGKFVLYDNNSYIIHDHISPKKECKEYQGYGYGANGTFASFLEECGVTVNSID